jgi:hypothetical protein
MRQAWLQRKSWKLGANPRIAFKKNNKKVYSTHMKGGTKTSEFWISLSPVMAALVESLKGDSQNSNTLLICGTVLGALYIVSRTLVKIKTK